jgi:hypothetical protein
MVGREITAKAHQAALLEMADQLIAQYIVLGIGQQLDVDVARRGS